MPLGYLGGETRVVKTVVSWVMALGLMACSQSPTLSPAIADPPADKTNPASSFAFTIPSGSGAMNAMLYTASGAGPHPTVLLLHGFAGNEQNLDLAQAARRSGWNVLTLHYRGTWGSAGGFSFVGAADDVRAAIAFLSEARVARQYSIDPLRIAIVGHSMGGMMGADAAADDRRVNGLFLIDPWDMSAAAKELETTEGAKAWHEEMVVDQPALSGTDEATLAAEMRSTAGRFDLGRRLRVYGRRPLDIVSAQDGNGPANSLILNALRASENPTATGETWPTDHSFNDRRIALSERLVAWLTRLPKPKT